MTRRTSSRERGAVMVETALVLPLLIALAFGSLEFGIAWNNKLEVETAARAGARVGSSLGTERLSDYNLLQSVNSALSGIGLSAVDYVVVFDAGDPQGAVPPACTGSPPTSQNGLCNVYTGAQLQTLSEADFTGEDECTGTAPDRFWCPVDREDVQHVGADYLGVWIRVSPPTVTRLFGSTIPASATAVMRLEPAGAE